MKSLRHWSDTVSVVAQLTHEEVAEAMANARLEHRKGHVKAILVVGE